MSISMPRKKYALHLFLKAKWMEWYDCWTSCWCTSTHVSLQYIAWIYFTGFTQRSHKVFPHHISQWNFDQLHYEIQPYLCSLYRPVYHWPSCANTLYARQMISKSPEPGYASSLHRKSNNRVYHGAWTERKLACFLFGRVFAVMLHVWQQHKHHMKDWS